MADLSVTFLGTGDPFASGGRLQSCILLDDGDQRILLDCGATALAAMARHEIDPATIDAVIVSHLHGDHIGGLPFLILHALIGHRHGPDGPRTRRLRIAGPSGTEERVRQAMVVFGYGDFASAQPEALPEFTTLEAGRETVVGPFAVWAFAAVHTPEALALRLSRGETTIGYSGDTAWTDALLEVAADADLFVCQVYSYEIPSSIMLSYRTLTEQRERLRCRRLILTHIGAEMQRRLADVSDEVAEDGMRVTL